MQKIFLGEGIQWCCPFFMIFLILDHIDVTKCPKWVNVDFLTLDSQNCYLILFSIIIGCQPSQGIQGNWKNQGNMFHLKMSGKKSGNWTNSRDNQGNIREIMSLFLQ